MGNDMVKVPSGVPTVPGEMRQVKMGANSKYYENIGTLKQDLHITVLNLPDAARQQIPLWSRDCYNLFVIDGADFHRRPQGCFDIVGDEILKAGFTSDVIRNSCLPLTTDIKSDISVFPCIFANRNHDEGKPGERQAAVFGYITEIRESRGKVTIHYQAVKTVSQKGLHTVFDGMGIKSASCANEFDIVHWAIKEIDLFAAVPGLEDY